MSPTRRFKVGNSDIEVGAATSGDVLGALAKNQRFPDRQIDLASIALETGGNRDVQFDSGAGKVSLAVSGSARVRVGIFDKGDDVLKLLALQDGKTADVELVEQAGTRLALFVAGYDAEGSVSAKHPLGILGSVTFGVTGAHGSLFAVVHRFPAERGALEVLGTLFSNARLPRQIGSAEDMAPGTMVIAEANGSLAIKVGAQVGYDFNFIREAKALGLTGDIGLKIEAGVKATLGFDVSGRYLVTVERPTADPMIRLRLFKLDHKGWNFGLNLSAKVQTVVELPDNVDDLVKAVFGFHGQQIIRDLHALESKWLSKDTDLSDTVAGLVNKTGLDLLRQTTGVDPATAFNQARGVLMSAITRWETLPSKVSAFLWAELEAGGLTGASRDLFEDGLKVLASNDEDAGKKLVTLAVSSAGFNTQPLGRLLIASADRGLAALIGRADDVRPIAQAVLDVLDGGVIEKLQQFIVERLNLQEALKVAKETDFTELDGWLVQRLSLFLDKQVGFAEFEEVKKAVGLVLARRHEIYAKARQALNRRYDFDLAVAYQSATTKTALFDVEFDTSSPAARDRLRATLVDADFDTVLVDTVDGVRLKKGVLTHGIERKGRVQVNMPFYSFQGDSLTKSLGRVTALEEGGRVLFYELDSSDTRTVRNRLTSQLSLSAALPIPLGSAVRVHGVEDASWAYEIRTVHNNLRRTELETLFVPMLNEYFGSLFALGGPSSISTFITDLDRAVEDQVHNGTDEFGDVFASLELSLPTRVVAAWFRLRDEQGVRDAARAVACRIQTSLRRVLPLLYFQNLDRLMQNGAGSPLLVWSALPAANDFQVSGDRMVEGKGVFWDVLDPALRRFLVRRPETIAHLGVLLANAKRRLEAAGRRGQASFFVPTEIGDFLNDAHVQSTENKGNFVNLLLLELGIITAVEDALRDIRKFHAKAETKPSKAIEALADAGEKLTSAFHGSLSSIYGPEATRMLGSMLFVEGGCALDPALAAITPTAVLGLTVLREERTFRIEDFLVNKRPTPAEIAVEQRLVVATAG